MVNHVLMVQQVTGSIPLGGSTELFLVLVSVPQLVQQMLCYVIFDLHIKHMLVLI